MDDKTKRVKHKNKIYKNKIKYRREYLKGLIVRILILFLACSTFTFWKKAISGLTFACSFNIMRIFYPASIIGRTMFFEDYSLIFIDACSASSAFLLLFVLIFLTKNISLRKRFLMFVEGSLMVFSMNLLRIAILIIILLEFGTNYFEVLHLFFWQIVSTFFVFITWIHLIKKYQIKSIPVYSDYKEIVKMLRR